MAENTNIEWAKHTLNLWWGCTEIHEGCDNCYAKALAKRWGEDVWGNDKSRRAIESAWKDLVRFQRIASDKKEIHRVFVGSMMDIVEKPMPLIHKDGTPFMNEGLHKTRQSTTGDAREILFKTFIPTTPNLQYLFLTKRPRNYNKYIPAAWKDSPPKNVMFGASVVNQKTANKMIPELLEVNGARFLSIEPQLDIITLNKRWIEGENKIDWIICGGESGSKRRPFNPNWARRLRDQCKEAGVPFFMKQIDKVQPIPEDLLIRELPKTYSI